MSDTATSPANSRLALLALGLLVGFVIGFIMLLSRLPVDSTLTDFNVSEVSSARMQGKDFEFVGPDYNYPKWHGEGAGIAIRKGEGDLVAAFNAAIEKIRADGTYQKINAKYFDFDIFGG